MPIVNWFKEETVAIVSMNNGENRHNLEFAEAMNRLLDQIAADTSITGLVLTSSDEKTSPREWTSSGSRLVCRTRSEVKSKGASMK